MEIKTAKRNNEIFSKKEAGMSLRAIGKEYDISATRVRQIYYKEKRKRANDEVYKALSMDSVNYKNARLLNVVCRYLGKKYKEITIDDILNIDEETLKNLRNVGKDTVQYFKEIKQRLISEKEYIELELMGLLQEQEKGEFPLE